MDPTAAADLLRFEEVGKRFGGTLAVDGVSLSLREGRILALLGENGAGKSTLIKMLAGIHAPDAGRILFRGEPYRHRLSRRGERQAVAFIHQDLGLIDWMTVAENVALGVGYERRSGLISWRRSRARALSVLRAMSADIDPDARIMHLGRTGIGMIYVSHRLDEVFQVADEVAVLRDGRLIGRKPVADTSPEDLVGLIVGRPPEQVFVRPDAPGAATCLVLDGLVAGDAGPVSLTLREGEMVGLVGLRGAGQDAIGRALFGCREVQAGGMRLAGRPSRPLTPGAAMREGVGLVAGERVAESLGMPLSVRENMFLNPGARGHALLRPRSQTGEASDCMAAGARMSLRPNDPARPVETLSGGNQQKVVLARWLGLATRLLVLEEPTAGVDVGAKTEIYALLRAALAQGLSIIVVATDFEEVAAICHRALVFSQGRVTAEIGREAMSVQSLLQAASAGGVARAHPPVEGVPA